MSQGLCNVLVAHGRTPVHTAVIFYEEHASVGKQTPIQLRTTALSSTSLHLLPISCLVIHFSDGRQPVTINQVPTGKNGHLISLGELGDSQSEAIRVDEHLDFSPKATQIFYGTVTSATAVELKVTPIKVVLFISLTMMIQISKLTLRILEAEWIIDVNFDPSVHANLEPLWHCQVGGVWKDIAIQRADPSGVMFVSSSGQSTLSF